MQSLSLKCQYCSRQFDLLRAKSRHENQYCRLNPNWKLTIPWNKGLDNSDPRIAKISASRSESTKGISRPMHSETSRKKMSESKSRLYELNPEKHPNRRLANNRKKMSYPEKVAYDWLTRNNIQFEHQKYVKPYWPDFIVGFKVIEIDGSRWHNKDHDNKRDAFLESLGYQVFRIKATDRIEDSLAEILVRV